tara:strand:- start:8022 stop:15224 length:7203 start_codon:yes stop_codon:yes gene_type:complete
MSFKKIAFNSFKIEPLNHPKDWEVFELPEMIKTASVKEAEENKFGGFDVQASIDKHPDHLFVKIFAIEKDIVNDNGDAFCEAELKKAANTFIGVPVFTNHQNNDVENARGECVHSWYDNKEGGIFLVARIDKVAYPRLARSIEEGYCKGCFPPNAPVLMSDGTERAIIDIQPGDKVISGAGNIRQVLGKQQRAYSYPLYSIKTEGISEPLVCTAGHNVVVYRLPEECACGCGEELMIHKDSRVTRKNFSRIFKQGHNPKGQKFHHKYLQKVQARDLQEGDFLVEPKFLSESNDDWVTEDEAFLIGLFLAEGSFEKRNGVRYSAIFNFAHTELETLAFRCAELLEKVFSRHRNAPTTNFYPKASQTRVNLYGKDIADWFYEKCGEYSDGKRLHPKLLHLSPSKTASLLAGYIEGDGYNVKGRYYGAATVSPYLASQLRILMAKIGVRANFALSDDDDRWGHKLAYEIHAGLSTAGNLREKLIYKKADESLQLPALWHTLENVNLRKIKKIDQVDFDGIVYDIEVEEDHTYCVNHLAVSNTSMGCSVDYSVCSVCHHKSPTAETYCDHVKNRKNRKVSGDYPCEYHDGEDAGEEPCPVCGKQQGEKKTNHYKEQQIYEHNYGLKFIENSFVVNPACHRCGVCDILHVPSVTQKIAELKESIGQLQAARGDDDSKLKKVAGQEELNSLTESMSGIERVVKSMFAQKNEVSMEYVSSLVKAMADLQDTYDELSEMGYAQLPSPAIEASGDEVPQTEAVPPPQEVQPAPTTQVTPSGISTQDMSGLGSVTKPKFSSNFLNKKKDLFVSSSKVRDKIKNLKDNVNKLSRSPSVSKTYIEVFGSDPSDKEARRIIIDKTSADGTMIIEAQGEKIIRSANVSTFPEDVQKMIDSDPEKAGKEILANKELINAMPGTKKTDKTLPATFGNKEADKTAAVGNPANDSDAQTEVITEKQLSISENADLHPRTNETWEQITEAEISGEKDATELDDTTSASPQTRSGSYDVITQGQLDSITDGYVTRWKDWPEVITEKQWTDFSRLASAKLPDDWTETITEDQLRELLSTHRFVGPPEVITEGQFKDQDYGIKRWASAGYSKEVIKIATQSISDAVAKYNKSPKELQRAAALANDDKSSDKVAFLTLLHSLPYKQESLEDITHNISYFKKMASSADTPTDLDALIYSVAKNGTHGVKVEDVYEAIEYSLGNKKAMAKVNELVQEKLAETKVDDVSVDKFAAFEQAIENINKPEDGLYEVRFALSEIEADPKDKKAFAQAVYKFGQQMIGGPAGNPQTVVLEIRLPEGAEGNTENTEDGTGIGIFKDKSMLTGDESAAAEELAGPFDDQLRREKTKNMTGGPMTSDLGSGVASGGGAGGAVVAPSLAEKREVIVKEAKGEKTDKEAQMMGGQMGGQGGAAQAPGAGATLPTPPGAMDQVPGMESFTDSAGPGAEGLEGTEDLEPKPPGSICVVCGSSDVDIVSGKGKCNNCSSEMQFKVSVDVTRWANLTPEAEEGGEMAEGLGEGEGFELPEGGGAGGDMGMGVGTENVGLAAMVRLHPKSIKKLAKSEIKLGSVSPANGKTNTVSLGKGNWYCLDTGTSYKLSFAADMKTKTAFAQWEWTPRTPNGDCPSCNRAKARFVKALKAQDITEEQFDAFDIQKKTETILKMKKAGALKNIKIASKDEPDVLAQFKQAYHTYGDDFPMETCLEKLSRRFGENALALSGPCEGKSLAPCVCASLRKAAMYNSNLAIKVGEVWEDKDGSDCCIEDQIRLGLDIKDAGSVCEALKIAMASQEDILAEKLAQLVEEVGLEDDMGGDMDVDPFEDEVGGEVGDEGADISVDVGDGDVGGEMVTLEIPKEVLLEFDAAADVALGSDPTDDLGPGDEVAVDVDVEEVPGEGEVIDDGSPAESIEDVGDVVEEKSMEEGQPCPDCGKEAVCPTCGEPKDNPADEGNQYVEGDEKPLLPGIAAGAGAAAGGAAAGVGKAVGGIAEGVGEGVGNLAKGDDTEASSEYPLKEATHMQGSIGKTQDIQLDLSAVAEKLGIQMKEGGEKEIQQENVQDGENTKPYSAGNPADGGHASEMGHENETVPTATKPTVPRDNALMGHEDSDLNPQDKPQPHIPSDKGTMGHEDEVGLEGGDARYTGGDEGAGKTNIAQSEQEILEAELLHMRGHGNAKDRLAVMAQKILEAQNKKLEPKKPVADDEDIKPIKGQTTMGHEPKFTADTPTNTETANNSHMGHEKETLGDKPTSPKDHPELPVDNALMGHEEDAEIGPEKQTRDKGTVIAESDIKPEVLIESRKLAFSVAAQMLQSNLIEASQLETKVNELAKYEPAQIKDFQNAIAKQASEGKQGLPAESRGLEQPLVINEKSSLRNANDELQTKLSSLFSLQKQNDAALELPDFALKQAYGKI